MQRFQHLQAMRNRLSFISNFPNLLTYAGVLLAVFSVMGALPLFRFGVWEDSTFTTILIFIAGAFIWSSICLLHTRISTSSFPLPILLALAMGLWAGVASLFSPYPLLSFFGSPQLAEGALSFIIASGLMLVVYLKNADSSFIRNINLSVLSILLVCAALLIFAPGMLYQFPDYFGVYAVFLPIVVHILIRENSTLFPYKNLIILISFVFSAWLANYSGNRAAAIAILGLGAIGWGGATFFLRRNLKLIFWLYPLAVLLIPFGILGIILYVGQTYQPIESGEDTTFYSLWSRAIMLKLTWMGFVSEGWASWLYGIGFGHSAIAVEELLWHSNQSFISPLWDGFDRDFIHTHFIPFEIFLSAGLPMGILYLATFASWFHNAKENDRAIVFATSLTYLAVASVWFQLIIVMPVLAVVMGTTLQIQNKQPSAPNISFLIKITGPLIICVMLFSATFHTINQIKLDYELVVSEESHESFDRYMGHQSFGKSLIETSTILANKTTEARTGYLRWLGILLSRYETELEDYPTSTLLLSGMKAFPILWYDNNPVNASANYQEIIATLWSKTALRFHDFAPQRADLLIPYLSFALSENSTEKHKQIAAQIINEITSTDPKNPVGLWYSGQLLLGQNVSIQDNIRAIKIMLKALKDGDIERFIRIPEDTHDSLQKALDQLKQLQSE